MPSRSHAFINQRAYHIYDKTLESIRIFDDLDCCYAFIQALDFYRFQVPTSLSAYRRFRKNEQAEIREEYMLEQDAKITIHAFVLMPTHYHLLVRQRTDGAIVQCMSNIINSITRYYNRRNQRKGPVFLPQFNSVPILGTAQLSYESKYIHRNPLKAKLVHSFDELLQWKNSSLPMYLGLEPTYDWIQPSYVLRNFRYSKKLYRSYVSHDENEV